MNEELEMNPKPAEAPAVQVAPLQSLFLKFVWLIVSKDWTNELIIVGLIVLGLVAGDKAIIGNIVSGLIGFMGKSYVDAKKESPV